MQKKLNTDAQLLLLVLLGPLFFILTAISSPLKGFILLPAAFALLLSSRWKMRGFVFSLPLLVLPFFIQKGSTLFSDMTTLAAFAAASFLTALSFAEAKTIFAREKDTYDHKLNEFERFVRTIRAEGDQALREREVHIAKLDQLINEGKNQVDFYKRLMELSQNEIVKLKECNERFACETFEIKRSSLQLENEQKKLIDALNEARVDRFQFFILSEAKSDEAEKVETSSFEADYRQLRKQFEEKSQVLNQTRKELFFIENELLALKKQEQFRSYEGDEIYSLLQEHIKEFTKQILYLEEEIVLLEQLISKLLVKKKQPKLALCQ